MKTAANDNDGPLERPQNATLDAKLGVRFPVLDHGFVALIDYMGNDAAIVQAARISYGKGTKSARDDRGLIRYLMRHRHTTPFEMVEMKFLVRLPIFVARQIIRHRTASVNEYSARYSVLSDDFFVPTLAAIQGQSETNKQGRTGQIDAKSAKEFQKRIAQVNQQSLDTYHWALEKGVARELARLVLPVNSYTEWYWKIDLHNFLHFLTLRLDPHAQPETRAFATAMYSLVQDLCPVAFEAFEDFIREGVSLSKREQGALSRIMKGHDLDRACVDSGLELERAGKKLVTGEGPEFLKKLSQIRASLDG